MVPAREARSLSYIFENHRACADKSASRDWPVMFVVNGRKNAGGGYSSHSTFFMLLGFLSMTGGLQCKEKKHRAAS